MKNIALRQRILDSKRTPTLPNQARVLLQAFSNDTLSYQDLATIVANHPPIAARLIALANSAWAAPSQPVDSLEKACLNLGINIVRSVSIGLTLISPFNVSACPSFDLRHFWISSKLVADIAVMLASSMPTEPQPAVLHAIHTEGLLHNLGLLCLADILPKETHHALTRVNSGSEQNVMDTLRVNMGTDYCEIGGLFAEIWGLPPSLVTVIQHHCANNYRGDYWDHTQLIGGAAKMVSAAYKGQQTAPELAMLEPLSIKPDDRQHIFGQLQFLLPATTELANALFRS